MRVEIKDFPRKELLEHYSKAINPFTIVTTKIDITNVYKYCRVHKHTYATLAYVFTVAMNSISQFKYTYENGTVYQYDILNPNFTELKDEETIGFYTVEMRDSIEEFIVEYDKVRQKYMNGEEVKINDPEVGELWFSCVPWFKFTGLIPPIRKDCYIPQMIWDEFSFEGERVYIDLMIMAHHGFVDGLRIAKLISAIDSEISKLKV